MGLLRGSISEASLFFFLFILLLFEGVNLFAEAVEVLLDGCFGAVEGVGDVADGESVEAEVEKCAFVGFEEREQMVVVGRSGGLLVGDGVVHPILEGNEAWLLDMVADLGDGDIEGYATYPCVGVAVASEAWPGLPEVTGNFLVEVADCIGGAVGVVEADLEDGALAAVEHIKELFLAELRGGELAFIPRRGKRGRSQLSVVVVAERIRPKQGKQGMPCFGSVMLSSAVHMFVCRLLPGTCCERLGCGQFYPFSIILVAKIRKSNTGNENIFEIL